MCSHVLQPWDRRNSMTAPVRNITLWRNPVGVFYSTSRLGQHSLGESYLSAEMQSMYSIAPVDWANTRWESLIPRQRCSRCILEPLSTGPTLVGRVLSLGRDAVDVFYSPCRLGQHSLGESYPSAEMQSVYFRAPVDWANTRWESLIATQRRSRYIQWMQTTGLAKSCLYMEDLLVKVCR